MIWLVVHSVLLAIAGVLAWITGGGPAVLGVLAGAEALVAFVWLALIAGRPTLRAANLVTSIRTLASMALIVGVPGLTSWALPAIGTVALLTDLVDGMVARRLGPSAFGARLDEETDALFVLALSWTIVRLGGPAWVMAAGLARYIVTPVFVALPEPRFPRAFSLFAKTACAVAATLLVAATLPLLIGSLVQIVVSATAVGLLLVSFGWEAAIRLRARHSRSGRRVSARGVLSSVLTYYGVPMRTMRLRGFYSQWIPEGGLAFDIGAHVGNKTLAMRGLGARVVAIEPQPEFVRILHRLFDADDGITLVDAAIGAEERSMQLLVAPDNPTLSTLSSDWVESFDEHYGHLGIEWSDSVTVPVTTLDALIRTHGTPDFIKIDVEGYEAEVLAGLSTAVPALSFEYLPSHLDSALAALSRVQKLGDYVFAFTHVEGLSLDRLGWVSGEEMRATLEALPSNGRSGDVYARLA